MKQSIIACLAALLLGKPWLSHAQKFAQPQITDVKIMPSGNCENQGRSNTCWSFSGMSFFQAELIRMGKTEPLNLSEMFVVRSLYPLKAANYIRMHGKTNFGEGGEFTDDLLCLQKFGLMPQSAYSGGSADGQYNPEAMVKKLTAITEKAAGETNTLSNRWRYNFEQALDSGMKTPPQTFDYNGKTYTPKTFTADLGLNADDYIMLGSYTHHPYGGKFILEVPDNWNWQTIYNVTLPELTEIAEGALQKGYTIAWGADISEKSFDIPHRLATVPDGKGGELAITSEYRQQAFDDYETQDDHGMHIIGLAKDQNGKTYFKVKNSWGPGVPSGDYFYASEPYFQYKTTCIMVNKKALPKALAKKLGIKV